MRKQTNIFFGILSLIALISLMFYPFVGNNVLFISVGIIVILYFLEKYDNYKKGK